MIAINARYQSFFHHLYQNDVDGSRTYQNFFPTHSFHNVVSVQEPHHHQFTAQRRHFLMILRSFVPNFDALCHQHHLCPDDIPIIEMFLENEFLLLSTIGNAYAEVFQSSQQLIFSMELPHQDVFTHQSLYVWVLHP